MKKLLTPLTWIAVIAVIIMMMGPYKVSIYFNYLSIFLILIIVLPQLFVLGLFGDFINGFKFVFSRDEIYSNEDIKASIIAIELSIKLVIVSGLIASILGIITMIGNLSTLSKWGPYLSFSLCSLLYALFILAFIYPVNAKLKSMLIK